MAKKVKEPPPSTDRRPGIPEWLYRVETDETRALLRASSEFAKTGYAPFLQKAKDALGKDIAVKAAPSGPEFENNFFGCVVTTFARPLLPFVTAPPPPKNPPHNVSFHHRPTLPAIAQRRPRKLREPGHRPPLGVGSA